MKQLEFSFIKKKPDRQQNKKEYKQLTEKFGGISISMPYDRIKYVLEHRRRIKELEELHDDKEYGKGYVVEDLTGSEALDYYNLFSHHNGAYNLDGVDISD